MHISLVRRPKSFVSFQNLSHYIDPIRTVCTVYILQVLEQLDFLNWFQQDSYK
jgi:hypothetical protein